MHYQNSQTDLIIILVAILCIITINLPFFLIDIAIKNILSILLLFIPGYAIISSFFPYNNFSKTKKVSSSILISLGVLFVIIILKNLFFSSLVINEPDLAIFMSLVALIFVTIGYIRRKRLLIDEPGVLICKECGGYYRLKEREKLEDFDKCQCGGQLKPDFEVKSVEAKKITVASKKIASKSIYFPKDLILIFLATIISLILSFNPNLNQSIFLTIIALPFLTFLPGYSVMAALYPKKGDLEDIERLAFSFGISILIAPVIGIILNYTPLGIKLAFILIVLSIFTFLMNIMAYFKRWRLNEKDRFNFGFK